MLGFPDSIKCFLKALHAERKAILVQRIQNSLSAHTGLQSFLDVTKYRAQASCLALTAASSSHRV